MTIKINCNNKETIIESAMPCSACCLAAKEIKIKPQPIIAVRQIVKRAFGLFKKEGNSAVVCAILLLEKKPNCDREKIKSSNKSWKVIVNDSDRKNLQEMRTKKIKS